jgi:hypothetical protein
MKTTNRRSLLLATVSISPICWAVLFATAARVKLGHWPTYGHPDPKDLFGPISFLGLILLSPLPLAAAVVAGADAWNARRLVWSLLVTACSFAGFVLWVVLDPGGLGEWVAD